MGELKLAFRRLRQRPAATMAAILALACSIGAAAATWSLLSAVLLRPLPIRDADRVFVVGQSQDVRGMPSVSESHNYPVLARVRETGAFGHVAAGGAGNGAQLVDTDGRLVRTDVYFCTYDWFDLLGVRIPFGRTFTPQDDTPGAPPVAILSDRYWRGTFAADPQILGRLLTVAGVKVTVVGVAPPGFRGLSLSVTPDIYLPFHTVADISGPRTNFYAVTSHSSSPTAWVTLVGRLARDVTSAQASDRLGGLERPPVGGRARQRFMLVPANTAALPSSARAGIVEFSRLLVATVALLLLIGCTTVGMLLLVRTDARRAEFAMCLALGASRGRLARGVALEGAIVSLGGALLALPTALWLFALVGRFQLPGRVAIDQLNLWFDSRVVVSLAASAAVATMLIAIVAGAFSFSADVADALRSRAGATPRLTRRRTRTILAAGEVAVALVLLSGAGLFARSLSAALSLNDAFDSGGIVAGSALLSGYGYTPATADRFASDLAARMRGNASIASFALMENNGGMSASGRLVINNEPRQFPTLVSFVSVDEHYFATMRLRLVSGRDFSESDSSSSAPVVIVSESFGRMLASGASPLGYRIRDTSSRPPAPPPVREVVGVVPDVITTVAIDQPLVIYFPRSQTARGTFVQWLARANGDAPSAVREMLSAIKAIDPQVTPSPMLTLREQLGRQMSAQQFGGVVLGSLGVIAALLTALGIFVLVESTTATRLREIGIRSALGASRSQLAGLVLGEAARLVGLGLMLGLGLAWLGAGAIRSFLFRVQPLDALTLGTVAALIAGIALAVSLKPALRAARVDVTAMLRES
jgi:putative ABC transport system permease protein